MAAIGVIGATSWGTTLAMLLARNGHDISLVARSEAEADDVREHGLARLPGMALPPSVRYCWPGSLSPSNAWIVAVPAQSVRPTLATLELDRTQLILNAAKGLEAATERTLPAVLLELGWPSDAIATISGPNLAPEIVAGLPAAAVVASTSDATAGKWQDWFRSSQFRVYRSTDVVGVSLGGALKNIIAVAAGAAFGLGLGTNAVAAVVTRGLAEMTRLAVAYGASPATLQGLAGVGDLVATCFSPLSRNRRYGEHLAAGMSDVEARAAVGGVVEGAWTAGVAVRMAQAMNVELPIAEQVARAVAGQTTAATAMLELLARKPRPEESWPVLD